MKISELKTAPQWLLDADTGGADVEMDRYDRVSWHGGVWRGGEWRGGEWHGGVWHGGVWHGGVWHGGEWHGGVWHGGVWHGGEWRGGEWHGGEWRGGEWHGGEWHGGEWRGGEWRGERTKTNLWTVYGLRWPVTISDTRMQIGCEVHPFEDWSAFGDARIVQMDRSALKFWRTHGAALLALCDSKRVKA